jgi:cyanophycinase-like exopeptidase
LYDGFADPNLGPTAMDARRKLELFLQRPLRRGRASATHEGTLFVIGGHEDRTGERKILRAFAERLGDDGKVVVCTIASAEPESLWAEYESAFRAIGVPHVFRLDLE